MALPATTARWGGSDRESRAFGEGFDVDALHVVIKGVCVADVFTNLGSAIGQGAIVVRA